MTGFLIASALLVALVLALLFRPFYWKSSGKDVSRRQLNAVIYRDQLVRLDRDRDEKMIGAEDYTQSRAELQRRLIEDASVEDAHIALHPPKKTMLSVALAVPLVAIGIYLWVGSPAALNPVTAQHGAGSQDLERMMQGLIKKLESEPENLQGWAMLARSYKSMGRSVEAEQAYARAAALVETDAQLLADYADVIASNANGNLNGKPAELIEKALKIDPNNGMVQWLAGTAAFQRNDFEKALLHWEILLPQLTTGSEDEQIIQNAIADANARLGKPSAQVVRNAVQAGTGAPAPTKTAATNPKGSVSGTVEIDPALKAKASATDIIMVIARLPGTRVPLAVLRAPAAQVPLKFTLDDSLAMNPQALLSAATQVELEVRISKTGMAMPDSGDLLSSVQTVKVGASGLKLRIDHVRP